MMQQQQHHTLGKAKVGAVAGLVAGCALFSSFFAIDQQLGIPNGTFYKTVGIPMGLEGAEAIAIGFMAHMSAAALIGATYSAAASKWRTFQVITPPKGILMGAVTGLIVFTVFFLPINHLIMTPAIVAEFSITDQDRLSVEELEALYSLLVGSDTVLWYGLWLHVLFGTVMGLMVSFILHDDYKMVKRIKGFW
ncbi:MAG: hypothetical protein GTN97_02120 [Nitrosopumilaceae archaeon]|nr:hypothetical protein [Nitrosopumilaceae archaeon]NIP09948.1 hypothetical protein [Nitrosopumilaceae archaeon]NIS94719.1 hypothetical protein [Nitrosopumilaceae archaeon]